MVISPPEQPTARVKQLKEAFLSLTPEMCCERAVIYTEVYQQNESLPPVTIYLVEGMAASHVFFRLIA